MIIKRILRSPLQGWTGTERLSARWTGSYTSRARKPSTLQTSHRFRELPTSGYTKGTLMLHCQRTISEAPHPCIQSYLSHTLSGPDYSTANFHPSSFQSTNLPQLHSHLLQCPVVPCRVQYIFRPIPPDGVVGKKDYLSG